MSPNDEISSESGSRKDENLYDIAFDEIKERKLVQGDWAKAFSDAEGDNSKALARYISLRVEQIKKESPTDPEVDESLNPIYTEASTLRRFTARTIDLYWISQTVTLTVGYIVSLSNELSSAFALIHHIWYTALILAIAIAIDAIIYIFFGNTLGKKLMGIRVIDSDGEPLEDTDYALRNLRLWIHAYACGLPFVSLVTMLTQALWAENYGGATYEKHGSNVIQKDIGSSRLVIGTILILFIFSSNSIFLKIIL